MTDSNDPDRDQKPGTAPPAADAPKETRSSGRVAFDSRGNPVWEWQLETGVYSRDVSTQKLKKLDLGDLSIAESAIQKQPAGLKEAFAGKNQPGDKSTNAVKPARPAQPGGGFNPYDNSTRPSQSSDPYDNARALSKKVGEAAPKKSAAPAARKPAPAPPPRKASMLNRLDQWLQDRRRSKDADDDE